MASKPATVFWGEGRGLITGKIMCTRGGGGGWLYFRNGLHWEFCGIKNTWHSPASRRWGISESVVAQFVGTSTVQAYVVEHVRNEWTNYESDEWHIEDRVFWILNSVNGGGSLRNVDFSFDNYCPFEKVDIFVFLVTDLLSPRHFL